MAIAFTCPHCLFAYRLPEKFGGKQAKCKNPECRKIITIPKPITIPDDASTALSQEEADAAALAALADEPTRPNETAPEEKTIPVNCPYCDHKWTVPWAMGGKNVLCPNPECRQRVRVSEPKEDGPTDWRQMKTKLPSGAKQNFEKLEGVQDASDAKIVSGAALREADATGVEIEPRSLQEKLVIVLTVVGLVGGLALGIGALLNRRTTERDDQLMTEALTRFETLAGEMNPADAALASAVLKLAAAEHALRHNDFKKTKEAHSLLGRASDEVRRQPPAPGRYAVAVEVAFSTLVFAGSDEEVKDQLRFRWLPDVESSRPLRINEKTPTIFEELGRALSLLAGADPEFRYAVARRFTRELARRGQAELAANVIPLTLFLDPERDEARAVVALEIYKIDKSSPFPRQTAEELKLQKSITSISAQTLFSVLGITKPVLHVPPPPGTGPLSSDASLLAYTGLHLLEGRPEDALQLAKRGARPDVQLKLLALCAEWSTDAGPALDAARAVVEANRGKRDVTMNPAHVMRLSQAAAATGRIDQALSLADSLADDALKAWTRASAVREWTAANPGAAAEEAWAEAPDDPKRFKPGHALGRLLIARQNTRLTHDRNGERKKTDLWPTLAQPFGLAGIALGLQDR